MNLRRLIKFFGPYFILPIIPKVVIQENSFSVGSKTIMISDIESVLYRNIYSPSNKIFPFVGWSRYEILAKDKNMLIYGEHQELADILNKKLEIVTRLEHSSLGLIIRWKKPGSIYKITSIRDLISLKILEPLGNKEVSSNVFKILFITAGLVFLLSALWFFTKLLVY